MKRKNYLLYNDYLKNRNIKNKTIFVSKLKKSYLLGPIINLDFDEKSFYKRIISNSIYSLNIYRRVSRNKCLKLINRYMKDLSNNEVLEIFNNGDSIIHKIIKVPGVEDEK